ncbi:hypothetical protein K9N68_01915 [Kovacikia minuta CCNUW1]|uniref:hypothetical protein n=1 Tax=Kovacikia minuta TaxID=2931930 RepID=UPI001CCEAE55|nr:hypothetical protein [Kovacikia minuta]UBF29752.1 hypothetical protein K9N68_01915 [Kovacikia minuta CCNUW1]
MLLAKTYQRLCSHGLQLSRIDWLLLRIHCNHRSTQPATEEKLWFRERFGQAIPKVTQCNRFKPNLSNQPKQQLPIKPDCPIGSKWVSKIYRDIPLIMSKFTIIRQNLSNYTH